MKLDFSDDCSFMKRFTESEKKKINISHFSLTDDDMYEGKCLELLISFFKLFNNRDESLL